MMEGCVRGSAVMRKFMPRQEQFYSCREDFGKGTAEMGFMHGRRRHKLKSHEQDPSYRLVHGDKHMMCTSRLS
jgi:hypothetical protein